MLTVKEFRHPLSEKKKKNKVNYIYLCSKGLFSFFVVKTIVCHKCFILIRFVLSFITTIETKYYFVLRLLDLNR